MTVHLIGAGPGDPDLLTVKAVKVLRRADVVVYDRLIDKAVLDLAPPWAELIDVGKQPGAPTSTQKRINDVLINRGRRFDCVVRLKGGDPFVFGRGGEEALELRASGIATEVVPGITSALAAPMAAGIPVTMRGISSGFTVVTGHQDPNTERWLNWDALANSGSTLVILMGASRTELIAQRLLAAEMPADTPVAVVYSATTDHEQITRTTLAQLPDVPVTNPSTLIIGEVAAQSVLGSGQTATLNLNNHPQFTTHNHHNGAL
ncbi:MAG: uroporphyrinogen-III C-methyltransferase [Acidimicrobiia bacterium]|nr:uroporphyrinogen-III C-methyltransferase [Acidimicrobiia bacterium]MCY4456723.1 uroporphyrinogen-III C-methyltransferase [Acidimicrobiaceae bacterium]